MAKKPQKKRTPKHLHIEVMRQMVTLATSGFGLVAALAWNSAIQEFVNSYVKVWLPGQSGLVSLLVYAIIVTIFAVVVTLQLSRILEKLERR